MNRNSTLMPAIGLIVALTLVGFGWYSINKIPDNEFPEFKLSFSLHSADGPVNFSDTKGKVGLIFFGYAHCPDVCPATMVNFGQALDRLTASERSKVKAMFVSLDPMRDSPEVMKKYVGFFHSDITGLAGSVDEIDAAAKSFLIAFEKDKANELGNYSMNHSTYIFITRPDGNLGNLLSHKSSPDEIVEVLRHWIKWAA